MKKNSIYNKLLVGGAFLLFGGLASCDDFLTVLPTDQITEEDFWKDKNDVSNARAGAYRQMVGTDCLSKVLIWGEFRSDNLTLNDMSKTSVLYLQDGILRPTESMFDWTAFYTGINYCNKVLEKGQDMVDDNVDQTFREGDWKPIKAEMYALRALNYFYLVRSFRDVPFVTTSISTDAEARRHKPAATPGAQILGHLIDDLEEAMPYAAGNYGVYGTSENYLRFTRRSIKALLADMYLWRGCMLKHIAEKGDTIVEVNGDSIYSQDKADPIITECFTKAKDYCSDILTDMGTEYKEYLKTYSLSEYTDSDYPPLIFNVARQGSHSMDQAYYSIFGSQYSPESILEWENDPEFIPNKTYSTYLSSYSNSSLNPQWMTGSSRLLNNKSVVDGDGTITGFTKTDVRMLGTLQIQPGVSQSSYPILKNIAIDITPEDWEDMNEGYYTQPNFRVSTSMNANWPVYRMSDVMLMKAEACARLNADLAEGFKLVNTLFERNNPALKATDEEGADPDLTSSRLNDNYADGKTAADLLGLVYRERQREFVAEGKRWFDLVRYAEAENSPKDMLELMLGASSTLKNRLSKLPSLYNPIYSEELKVNPNLVQNSVWDKYTK